MNMMDASDDWSAKVELLDSQRRGFVSKKGLTMLKQLYDSSIQHALVSKGLDWAIHINGNNNNVNINISPALLEETDGVRSIKRMVDLMIAIHPDFETRFVYSPSDIREHGVNGIWYCDHATNIWRMESNVFLDQYIIDRMCEFNAACAEARCQSHLTGVPLVPRIVASGETPAVEGTTDPASDPSKHLNEKEVYFIESLRGSTELRISLSRRRQNPKFEERLDANMDLFACENGVFVTNEPGVPFRPIRLEDKISVTTGWKYVPEESHAVRADVDRFLEQVLPVAEERVLALTFIADLMSGYRRNKRFAVFTDKRGGNNGKSMLADLVVLFYNNMSSKDGAKLVTRPAVEHGNRNSHDAGIDGYKNARVVVAEEMSKSMILDVGFIKKIVSTGEPMTGRACGSSSKFKYIWSAGLIVVFNQDNLPKVDPTDDAFWARLFVVPFRSKFVHGGCTVAGNEDEVSHEEWTYPADLDLKQKFPMWLSALADVMREVYDPTHKRLQSLPGSMMTWKADLQGDPLMEQLEELIEITGNAKDAVWFSPELRDTILKVLASKSIKCDAGQLLPSIRTFVQRQGASWWKEKKDLPDTRRTKGYTTRRNVGLGVRMVV